MRRETNKVEKCKKVSTRKGLTDSDFQENTSISQKDELPGVDYKNKLGPRSLRHNKLDLNTDHGEASFLSSVRKELNRKQNVQKIQTAFGSDSETSGSTLLASKTVIATNQYMLMSMSSPLEGASLPCNVEKNKNPGLTKELKGTKLEDEDEYGEPIPGHVKPTVLGLNMKWRNGIQLKQCHKYTTRTVQIEAVMRKTDFDFETKTKFNGQVEATIEELFPDARSKLMILDGNAVSSSEASTKVARSDKLYQDQSPSAPYEGTGAGNPYAREWTEFTDMEEHRILVIPSNNRNGFDMDLQRKYEFPYSAKFVIGRKAYHHKFVVQVPLSKAPQHYALIFTFSEDPKGHSKIRIKSLLTVYSIFPVSTKYACLETYERDNLEDKPESSPSNSRRKSYKNQSTTQAKNAVQLITENLKEENILTSYGGGFQLDRNLEKPAQDRFRGRRLYSDNLNGKKDKKKKYIVKNITSEQQDTDTVLNSVGKPFRRT